MYEMKYQLTTLLPKNRLSGRAMSVAQFKPGVITSYSVNSASLNEQKYFSPTHVSATIAAHRGP